MTLYRLIVLGRDGMYTYGTLAATPALARLAPGHLIRRRDGVLQRLGITQSETCGTWTDSAGNSHTRYTASILVEAEDRPGQWTIGAAAEVSS